MIAAVGGVHSGPALKAVTAVVPIVFVSAGDPVAFGLVSSLNGPNGNVTGISMIAVALAPKRLQLLHEVNPVPADMAMLANPSSCYFDQEKMDVMASARATVYQWREFATIGGLMSYGTSILAAYQQAGLTSRKY